MENEKMFQLPKEFTQKWLKALRSGEYKQTNYRLYRPLSTPAREAGYCCLGVAMHLLGAHKDDLIGRGFPSEVEKHVTALNLLPAPLRSEKHELAEVLSGLNDGDMIELSDGTRLNEKRESHSFEQIADWIEKNVEFT